MVRFVEGFRRLILLIGAVSPASCAGEPPGLGTRLGQTDGCVEFSPFIRLRATT